MILDSFSLKGKVAWITGASYGIGFAIATAFHEAGAKIVFNDINQELVDRGLASYKEIGIDAKGYVCDVTNEEQVTALAARILQVSQVQVSRLERRSLQKLRDLLAEE